MGMVLATIQAIDAVASRRRVIETAQHTTQCRFAGCDAADQADPFAWRNCQVDVRKCVPPGLGITETNMLHL